MTWVRIDDHFDQHPKLATVGPLGIALWVAGLAYCNRNLTDGFIPWGTAQSLLAWEFLGGVEERGRKRFQVAVTCGMSGDDVTADFVIRLLTDAGLWEEVDGGYRVHDYGDYQPSKEEVLAERAKTRERVAKFRNARGNGVTNGDVTLPPVPVPVPVPDPVPVNPYPTPTEETIVSSSGVVTAQAPKPHPRRTAIEVMSDSQLDELAERYGREYVLGKLDYGRNRQDWETKHKSEYATIKRWCEQDAEDGEAGQTDSIEDRRKRFLGGSLGRFIKSGNEAAG